MATPEINNISPFTHKKDEIIQSRSVVFQQPKKTHKDIAPDHKTAFILFFFRMGGE